MRYIIELNDPDTKKTHYLKVAAADEWTDNAHDACEFDTDTDAMKVAQYLKRYSNIIKVSGKPTVQPTPAATKDKAPKK